MAKILLLCSRVEKTGEKLPLLSALPPNSNKGIIESEICWLNSYI